MNPRTTIASQIYTGLILQDLQASIKNPMINAQRALLFADALLICDATNNQDTKEDCSMEVEVQTQGGNYDQAIMVRAAKARFAGQLDNRRGPGRSSLN